MSNPETSAPDVPPSPREQTFLEEIKAALDPRGSSWLSLLLLSIPVAIGLWASHQNAASQFVFSALAIIPLAGFMGDATEVIAIHSGPGIGGLLNATFGNAAELIIALFGIFNNLDVVVKASLSGSMIGNCLLVLGCAMITGGAQYKVQYFNKDAASTNATMAIIAAIGLVVPAFVQSLGLTSNQHGLSKGVSIILIISYAFLLVFSLLTHRNLYEENSTHGMLYERDRHKLASHRRSLEGAAVTRLISRAKAVANAEIALKAMGQRDELKDSESANQNFSPSHNHASEMAAAHKQHVLRTGTINSSSLANLSPSGQPAPSEAEEPHWSLRMAILVLIVTTGFVAFMSEILVGSVESAGDSIGISQTFMGFIVLAIVGNAAEHSTAIMMAYKDRVDIAVHIALGSTLQIALFVAPLLVLISYGRSTPMDLVFTELEVYAVFLALLVVWMVVNDGASTWVEGFMLVMLYFIFAVAFGYVSDTAA